MDSEFAQLVERMRRLDAQLDALLQQGDAWLKELSTSITDNALYHLQELNEAGKALIMEIDEDGEAFIVHMLESFWPAPRATQRDTSHLAGTHQ